MRNKPREFSQDPKVNNSYMGTGYSGFLDKTLPGGYLEKKMKKRLYSKYTPNRMNSTSMKWRNPSRTIKSFNSFSKPVKQTASKTRPLLSHQSTRKNTFAKVNNPGSKSPLEPSNRL